MKQFVIGALLGLAMAVAVAWGQSGRQGAYDAGRLDAGEAMQAVRAGQSGEFRGLNPYVSVDASAVDGGTTVTDPADDSQCFELPNVRLDGGPALLNRCTGEVWRFDDGWDGTEYARAYSFVKVR